MVKSSGAGSRRARVGRGQRWSAAEKAKYLTEFAASGMSGAAFVRKTGLPQSTFDLWRSESRRGLRKRLGRQRAETGGFARVEVVRAAAPSGITLVVRCATDLAAEFGGLDAASAVALLETVLSGAAAR